MVWGGKGGQWWLLFGVCGVGGATLAVQSRSRILLLCQQSLSGLGKWWKFSGISSRNLQREAVVSVGEDQLFEALLRPALNGFRLLMDWKSRSYEAK